MFTYERKKQPLASWPLFFSRFVKHLLLAAFVILLCLLIGLLGFHYFADASWMDAIHNSSMLLSGMGPVITITSTGGKLFSSGYALFSGIILIANAGIISAPIIHRIFHRLHLDSDAT